MYLPCVCCLCIKWGDMDYIDYICISGLHGLKFLIIFMAGEAK